MDEFVVFLLIGLIAIAVLFALFGPYGMYNQTNVINISQFTTTTTIPITQIPTEEGGKILIGPQSVEVWRTIKLGEINVSYGSYEKIVGIERKRLFNGLLFGSNKLEINAPVDLKNFLGAYIEFSVEKTNKYAPLLIKVNGNVINKTKFTEGTYRFLINSSLIKENNKIEFIPLSSSWKIWAPTVYDLKDVKFSYRTHYSRPSSLTFTIYDNEYNNLADRYGRIILDLEEHKGSLNIDLNGNKVYSNKTKSYEVIYFDQFLLQPGENRIDFYAEENAQFFGNARMLIYYYTTKENTLERIFSLSEEDYNKLDIIKGKIRFNVTDIINPGGLEVIIKDQNGEEHVLAYELLEKKKYTFYFNSSYCSPGYNKVIIKSIDNAAFWINEFKIEV